MDYAIFWTPRIFLLLKLHSRTFGIILTPWFSFQSLQTTSMILLLFCKFICNQHSPSFVDYFFIASFLWKYEVSSGDTFDKPLISVPLVYNPSKCHMVCTTVFSNERSSYITINVLLMNMVKF